MTAGPASRRRAVLRRVAPVALLVFATIAVLLVRVAYHSTEAGSGGIQVKAVAKPTSAPPQRPERRRFYVIRSGDTLGEVAARFETTVGRLLFLNPGISPTSLRIGRKIRIA